MKEKLNLREGGREREREREGGRRREGGGGRERETLSISTFVLFLPTSMGTSVQVCPITAGMINSSWLPLSRSELFHDGISFFLWHVAMHWRHSKVCFPHFFCQPVNLWCHYKYYNIIGSEIPITWTCVHEKFQSCWDSVQSRICWAVMGPLIWVISKQVPSVFSMKFQNGFKVLSHEATCRHDKSSCVTCMFWCNSTQWLVAWIQIILNSCDMSRRQNVAHTFRPRVTCTCDMLLWQVCK